MSRLVPAVVKPTAQMMEGKVNVFVIADLCSNAAPFHPPLMFDQEPGTLTASIRSAARSGASAAKVQVFTRSHFPKEEREAKRHVEFPRGHLPFFVRICHDYGVQAGASVFDEHAVDACVDAGMDFLKLATREYLNDRLLDSALETNLPVYVSVPWTVEFFRVPSRRKKETFMACFSQYPTLAWGGIPEAARWLGERWGWSSHTPHYQDVLQAVAAGAAIIEKHLALSPDDPEAAWSLLPQQMKEMVDAIKSA